MTIVATYAPMLGFAVQIIAVGGTGVAIVRWGWPALVEAHKQRVQLRSDIKDIKSELRPNGGASLRDAVDKLGKAVDVLSSEHAAMSARQWAMVGALEQPTWESDAAGNCLRANAALLGLTGRSADELVGNGWENIVLPSDRQRVWAEWKDAVCKQRVFESEYTVIHADSGKAYKVEAVATPFFSAQGRIIGWIGHYSNVRSAPRPKRTERIA